MTAFCIIIFYCHLSTQPTQNRTFPRKIATIPLLRTKLASLVKGRWIDGTTQAVALLLSACDMSALFILQTFLPSRRRDCFTPTNLSIPTTLSKTQHTLAHNNTAQQNQKALRVFLKGLLNIQKIHSVINSLAAPPNISRESPALISGLSAFILSQRSIYPAISTLQSVFALSPESILSTAFEASL